MCGIFGFIASPGADCGDAQFESALEHLFRLSEPRGQEASGLVIAGNGRAQVFKRGSAPSEMIKSPDYKKFLKGRLTGASAVIGHCRLVTAGTETMTGNNPPIITEHSVGV
ncbi:MAG: hypothetical protein HQ512_06075, partial [Rhodospirillales bacterium]|nr:hypothetical protein [Rhodospirillales bacterium]